MFHILLVVVHLPVYNRYKACTAGGLSVLLPTYAIYQVTPYYLASASSADVPYISSLLLYQYVNRIRTFRGIIEEEITGNK